MSENGIIISTDQLPNLPETEPIEPIVQCGVLYLGSAPPSPGRRGLDSIQEPFAHRYPVDGINTVQGNSYETKIPISYFLTKVLMQYFLFMIMVFN